MGLIQRPIFVTGMGRSGTTLLQALLSAHSRLSIAPESHFMKNAYLFGGLEEGAPPDFQAFWAEYTSSVNFRDLGVSPEACEAVLEKLPDRSYRSIFSAMLTAYGSKVDKPRVGEKTPNHVGFLHQLLEWFPDARVLILRRDPRSVVASQLRSPWVVLRTRPRSVRQGVFIRKRSSALGRFATEWKRTYAHTVPAWASDPRVRIVSYEALVTEPERELREICAFLGEPFEAEMIQSRSKETVAVPAAELNDSRWTEWRDRHMAAALSPVDDSAVEKWKGHLSRMETAAVESWCLRPMVAAGYPAHSSRVLRLLAGTCFRGLLLAARVEERARGIARRLLGRFRHQARSS